MGGKCVRECGPMGGTCVRECERRTHELYNSNSSNTSNLGVPGHASGSAQEALGVRVGATFSDPMAAITGRGADVVSANGPVVPALQGLGQLPQSEPGSSPASGRLDDMSARGGSVAGEFRSPGSSPRELPRQLDAKADGGNPEELAYEGDREDGLKHGKGRLRMQGSTYEGEFRKDAKHGEGMLTWDDGRQFCGQFVSNKFHGSAVMNWPDGRRYCGQYSEDRKHGEGTFSWQDGRRYQGQWVVGKRHGVGVYTNAKGFTRTGMWQMDRPLHWDAVATPRSQDGDDTSTKLDTGSAHRSEDAAQQGGVMVNGRNGQLEMPGGEAANADSPNSPGSDMAA